MKGKNACYNYILQNTFGYSYRAIAFISNLSEVLGLGSKYLKEQCFSTSRNRLKKIADTGNQPLDFNKVVETKTETLPRHLI